MTLLIIKLKPWGSQFFKEVVLHCKTILYLMNIFLIPTIFLIILVIMNLDLKKKNLIKRIIFI